MFKNAAPAVITETKKTAAAVTILVAVEILVFFFLHLAMPDKVPFDYRVVLGAVCGGLVAVANFYLMGLTVQKASESKDEETAHKLVSASYSRRMLLQMAWVVIAIVTPCFQAVAGIVPLLFPGLYVKFRGVTGRV